jgi:endonuclease-8
VPEGDVVWRTAQRLSAALSGRELVVADLRWPSLATADLTGRTVIETVARGKHLLTRLAAATGPSGSTGPTGPNTAPPVTLHSHLRMDGSWRVDRTGSAGRSRSPDVRAVLANDEWTATGISLGMLDLVATTDEATLVGHLGPDILGPDWNLDRVLANLQATPERAIGAALLDQHVLAGVGTFYLAETMFLVGRTPWTPIGDLTDAERRRVVERAHRLLHLNRDRAVQVTTGDARPGHEAYAHGRSGRACRRCGTTVRMARIGQPPADRVACYCPTCQIGPTPTDDGRPQGPSASTGSTGRARPH